jgi:tetratricopeptide (TPR) repeat protein
MLSGRFSECLDWSQKALDLAEHLGLDAVAVMTRQFRGTARCELGDLGGLDDLREAMEASLELGLGQETVRAHINLGDFVWYLEGPSRGLEVHRGGIEYGERRGITGPVLWTKGETLWMLFDLGEWDELLRVADELTEWDRLQGGTYFGVMALSYKAQVLVRRGKVAEAAEFSEEFVPRARKIADPQILAPALVIAALIGQARGDAPAAVSLIEEFGGVTEGPSVFQANHVSDAARVCVEARALALGERLLGKMDPVMARQRHSVLAARAILAEGRGKLEEAAALYGDAAAAWENFGHALEHGQALLGLGRCLPALGRTDANATLAAARDVFTRLGAGPLVAETDGLLAEAVAARS